MYVGFFFDSLLDRREGLSIGGRGRISKEPIWSNNLLGITISLKHLPQCFNVPQGSSDMGVIRKFPSGYLTAPGRG